MPELEKIIMMSRIFSVETDKILLDEEEIQKHNSRSCFYSKISGWYRVGGRKGFIDAELIYNLYPAVGNLIERGECKEAIKSIFELARYGNKYFDTGQPWITRETYRSECERTLFNCVQIIANLAVLPEKVREGGAIDPSLFLDNPRMSSYNITKMYNIVILGVDSMKNTVTAAFSTSLFVALRNGG